MDGCLTGCNPSGKRQAKCTQLNRILVANRGEIACRIIKTLQKSGYTAIAVYSEADAQSRHVQLAHEAICIGAAEPKHSYLNIKHILNAAKETQAEAIHPGYGFLAESADFALQCHQTGFIFVGPSPESIALMGDKSAARQFIDSLGVQGIKGYQGANQNDDFLLNQAKLIGFPLMIKAIAGGGGRGVRRVNAEEEFINALTSARSESAKAFANSDVMLEKYLVSARHIEVQVLADQQGNIICLGDRDCSLQRRHQKLIEEAPAPGIPPEIREHIQQDAIKIAQGCHYIGAGTVEFLFDGNDAYFLEMNTRLQVEHPVTEMVTGIDIVDWQLKIACGQALSFQQRDVQINGHAIEARLCTEDPAHNFLPRSGQLRLWQANKSAGIRIDHGLNESQVISPFYDSLQAKLVACGESRQQAQRRLLDSLQNTRILGIANNRHFLELLLHDHFDVVSLNTERVDQLSLDNLATPAPVEWAMAATLLYYLDTQKLPQYPHQMNWSNSLPLVRSLVLQCGSGRNIVQLGANSGNQQRYSVKLNDCEVTTNDQQPEKNSNAYEFELSVAELEEHFVKFLLAGREKQFAYVLAEDSLYCDLGFGHRKFQLCQGSTKEKDDLKDDSSIYATMPGCLIKIMVEAGAAVIKSQPLFVIEAMKMEHQFTAHKDGIIKAILAGANDQVTEGQLLIEFVSEDKEP